MKDTTTNEPQTEAHQTVRLKIGHKDGIRSMQIGFTDQCLTAHGGLALWADFLTRMGFREALRQWLPHQPTSPNAYDPTDTALGLMGGILSGADKLSRAAHLGSDPALAEVLGIEAMPSQSTLSRFLGRFGRGSVEGLSRVHGWALRQAQLAGAEEILDLDSWALVHEDGHQEGVRVGYTRKGLKPCHRPIVAALFGCKLIAHFWLRPGNTACLSGAEPFLEETLARLPAGMRVGLVRADSGFCAERFLRALEGLDQRYIVAVPMRWRERELCRHEDGAWSPTEVPGLGVQEVRGNSEGRRLIVLRQRIVDRPQGGGRMLLEVPGYKFQALITNLPPSVPPVEVWRRYNGRADIENRIKELGDQYGIKGFCCRSFWATEAACHLAVATYNLCVLFQQRLGQPAKSELRTLRWRLFRRAAVFSRPQGQPTLRLAVRGQDARRWCLRMLAKLRGDPDCDAVETLAARGRLPSFL